MWEVTALPIDPSLWALSSFGEGNGWRSRVQRVILQTMVNNTYYKSPSPDERLSIPLTACVLTQHLKHKQIKCLLHPPPPAHLPLLPSLFPVFIVLSIFVLLLICFFLPHHFLILLFIFLFFLFLLFLLAILHFPSLSYLIFYISIIFILSSFLFPTSLYRFSSFYLSSFFLISLHLSIYLLSPHLFSPLFSALIFTFLCLSFPNNTRRRRKKQTEVSVKMFKNS